MALDNLTMWLNWIGVELQSIIENPATATEDLVAAQADQRVLTPLLNASIADGMNAAFRASQKAKDELDSLLKEMKATSDLLNQQQATVGRFLGIVVSLLNIFSAATGGSGAAGTVIAQIGAAADKWLS